MLEALRINGFLPKKPTKSLVGFISKAHAIAEAAYVLPEELLAELSQWASLRGQKPALSCSTGALPTHCCRSPGR